MGGPEKYCIPWSDPDSGMRMSHALLRRLILVHVLEILLWCASYSMRATARKIEGASQREGVGTAETMNSQVEERMLGGQGQKGQSWGRHGRKTKRRERTKTKGV